MSFLTGQTKELIPQDVMDYRKNLIGFLGRQGFGTAISGPEGGGVDIAPYQKLFSDMNAQTLTQAKESAGNLTGTGFANAIGTAAGRSASQQGAFLSQLMETARQAAAQRYAGLMGMPSGMAGQMGYQPGFLEQWMKMAGGVATAAAGAGAFA